MKIEKISEKSYRVRKQINGKRVSFLFDHKPTQAELYRAFAEALEEVPLKDSFQHCAESFIESKSNVISPKTAREYRRFDFEDFVTFVEMFEPDDEELRRLVRG